MAAVIVVNDFIASPVSELLPERVSLNSGICKPNSQRDFLAVRLLRSWRSCCRKPAV
jgi:hypothetical protein